MAGLVPAEALAIQTFIYEILSDSEGSDQEATSTITDVTWLRWSFIALLVLALGFYFAGVTLTTLHWKKIPHHFFRCLVIVFAFGVWTWLQPVSAWKTWVNLDDDPWLIVGALAAGGVVVLNLLVVKLLPLPGTPPPPNNPAPAPPAASATP